MPRRGKRKKKKFHARTRGVPSFSRVADTSLWVLEFHRLCLAGRFHALVGDRDAGGPRSAQAPPEQSASATLRSNDFKPSSLRPRLFLGSAATTYPVEQRLALLDRPCPARWSAEREPPAAGQRGHAAGHAAPCNWVVDLERLHRERQQGLATLEARAHEDRAKARDLRARSGARSCGAQCTACPPTPQGISRCVAELM